MADVGSGRDAMKRRLEGMNANPRPQKDDDSPSNSSAAPAVQAGFNAASGWGAFKKLAGK